MTIVAAAPPYITATERDHIASYIIEKDITYRNILKRSKKSPRLNLKINSRTAFRSK
jgi:2-keto-4-pentenoate hydratase/2-oxohepta-3-ene-1,7-dioic acid hydratase in catechol pathway